MISDGAFFLTLSQFPGKFYLIIIELHSRVPGVKRSNFLDAVLFVIVEDFHI
jgi:hypothetical protein